MTIVRESFNSAANSASLTPTVNAPSGVAAGDVLVCAISFNGAPGTVTPPAGWVQVAYEAGASNPRIGLYRKVAGAGEPSTYSWTLTTSVACGMVIARYSGVDNTTPGDVTAVGSFSAAAVNAFNLTGVTIQTAGAMLISCMSVNSATTSISEQSTLITQVVEVSGKRCELDDGIIASAGPTGTVNYIFGASRACAGIVWALRPAGSGGVNGALAVTLDSVTSAATGTVAVSGAASLALDSITATMTGKVDVTGVLAQTLDDAVLVATATGGGTSPITGELAVTLDDVTMSASGAVGVNGAANVTLDSVIATMTGAVGVSGGVTATLDPLTCSATGSVSIGGAASITLYSVTVTASGSVGIAGSLAQTLEGVTANITGVVGATPVLGSLYATLDDVVLSASGSVSISGGASVTLADLLFEAVCGVQVSGGVNVTLDDLTALITGTVEGAVTFVPIPAQTYRVPTTNKRRYPVSREDRTERVEPEDRVYRIEADHRTLTIGD